MQVVLLSGDLLDSAVSYYETHEVLLRAFSQIQAEIFIAPGNHDYYCPKSPYAMLSFPANVHIFRSPILESITLANLGCRIWGAGFNAPVCPPLLQGDVYKRQGPYSIVNAGYICAIINILPIKFKP